MKKIISGFCFMVVLFATISFTGCTSMPNSNPSAALVPEEAVIYVEVKNVDLFINGIDNFLLETGVSNYFGNLSIRQLVTTMIAMRGMNLNLEWFDMTKPAGLAILPESGDLEDWETVIMTLPLNLEGLDEQYSAFLDGLNGENQLFKQVGDYLVFFSQPELEEIIPPVRSLDTTMLDQYEEGSLIFYLDMEGFQKTSGQSIEDLFQESLGAMPDGEFIAGPFKDLMDLYMQYANEVEKIAVALTLNEKGLSVAEDLIFTRNGKVHKLAKEMKADGQALEYLKYIPQDSFFSMTAGINYSSLGKELKIFYRNLLEIYNLDQEIIDKYLAVYEEALTGIGPGMAMAFDMDLNLALFEQLGDSFGDFDPAIISDIFSLDVVMVSDIEEKEKYWAFYDQFDYNEFVRQMMESVTGMSGGEVPDIGFKLNIDRDLETDGFVYDVISYDFDFSNLLSQIENPAEQLMAGIVLESFLSQFKIYLHYEDGHYFGYMGKSGLEGLHNLVSGEGKSSGMSLAEAIAESPYASVIKPESDVIFQFSVIAFYNMIAQVPDVELSPISLENTPGLISSMNFTGNRVHATLAWEMREIKEIFSLLLPFILEHGASLLTSL